jgi:hypothetical protein
MIPYRLVPGAGRAVLAGLILAGWLGGAAPARANRPLQLELKEAAQQIARYLRQRSDSVAVSTFTCNHADAPPTNYGGGIYKSLCEELERLALRINPEARYIVSGTYRIIIDASSDPKELALKLELRLRERGSSKGFELVIERAVISEEAVVGALGLTVSLPPEASPLQRRQEIEAQVEKPKPGHLEQTRVFAKPDSPYGLEVLVKRGSKFEPCPVRTKGGLVRADLKRDDVYAVRLINNSDHESAVNLTIDGLDLFAFSDNRGAQIILKPKSTALVKGWPRTFTESNEFLVTEYARSAAHQLKSTGEVGVITANFAAAWPVNGPRPADEPADPNPGARATDATGHGAPFEEKYTPVNRNVGVLRATVAVRYAK